MKQRTHDTIPRASLTIALLSLAALSVATVAFAGEVTLEVGAWDADVDGTPDVVAEYESTDGGADLALDAWNIGEMGAFFATLDARGDDDQLHEVRFDIRRMVRSTTTYTAFPHRLGYDPLTNLEAATNHGRLVWHTDLDPGARYELDTSDLRHRTEIQPMRAHALTIGIDYRLQRRDGHAQALNISHCDSCHVSSQAQPIDQQTEDIGLDLLYAWASGSVRAAYTHRELTESAEPLTLLYDDALQPELRIPIFDNRVSFDSAQGPLPVHARPDIDKGIFEIGLAFPDVGGFAVHLDGVDATTENQATGLAADYRGMVLSAARILDSGWRLRLRARAYSVDNDEVFVDIAEPVSIAGPHAGRTYRDVYGFNPDYLRLSSLDRSVFESRVDVGYRISKRAGTLRFTWDHETIDRDNFAVAPGVTETVENVYGVAWRARPRPGLNLRLRYRHTDVDAPFANVDGAFSTLVSPRVSSPFAPNAAQYFDFQRARIADPSASPESADEVKLQLTYTPDQGQSLLSLSLRDWSGENDDGDLNDWSRDTRSATLAYWAQPSPTWQWSLAYSHQGSELIFPIAIPIFDG